MSINHIQQGGLAPLDYPRQNLNYRKTVVECRAPSVDEQPECEHYEQESKWSMKCSWRVLNLCLWGNGKKLHSKRVGE